MKITKCLNCRTSIEHIKSKQKYCSTKCGYEYNRDKSKKRYNENYIKKIPKKEKRNCRYCNKEFIWCSSIPQKIYCSEKCCKDVGTKKFKDLGKGIIKTKGKSYNFYKLRFEIFKRDNFICQYCGRNVKDDKVKLHCDHITPKSKGGRFVAKNLITSCEECNLGKRDVLLSEKALI